MRWMLMGILAAGCLVSSGCNPTQTNTATGNQQAVVMLKDGTSFGGTVTNSSTAEISVKAANGETRTYPMTEVQSVEYASGGVPAAAAPVVSAPAPAPPPAPAPTPMASVPPISPAVPVNPVAPPRPAERAVSSYPREVDRTVPAGRSIVVRNNGAIDSRVATPGQTYSAVIVRDVMDSNGQVVIPHGSDATLVVRGSRAQGKVEGQSELVLDLESVRVAGRRYRVTTSDVVEKGHAGLGANKRTAAYTGGGAVLGTLLGAIAGGGKGAAIGALSGAAAGGATQTLTRGHGVRVAVETVMTFRLEAPVRVTEEP